METESRVVLARAWGGGEVGNYCFMGPGFPFRRVKRVLGMEGGDGCTTV